jgi:hypothetical protein
MKYARAALGLITFVTLLVGFQNCSQFELGAQAIKNFSSACLSKARAETKAIVPADLCEDVANYSCERRVFKPGVEAGDSTKMECGGVDGHCVKTRTISYDTAVARDGATAEQFMVGGDYNREDIECTHDIKTNGASLIQATGETVFGALALTMQKCRDRSIE